MPSAAQGISQELHCPGIQNSSSAFEDNVSKHLTVMQSPTKSGTTMAQRRPSVLDASADADCYSFCTDPPATSCKLAAVTVKVTPSEVAFVKQGPCKASGRVRVLRAAPQHLRLTPAKQGRNSMRPESAAASLGSPVWDRPRKHWWCLSRVESVTGCILVQVRELSQEQQEDSDRQSEISRLWPLDGTITSTGAKLPSFSAAASSMYTMASLQRGL